MGKNAEFFQGLPDGKVEGFCEEPEGNPHASVRVNLENDCIPCRLGKCHMFDPVYSDGEVVARKFTPHPPEY